MKNGIIPLVADSLNDMVTSLQVLPSVNTRDDPKLEKYVQLSDEFHNPMAEKSWSLNPEF